MVASYIGSFNAYVPQLNGTVISFIRNPRMYPLAQYAQLVSHDAPTSFYLKLSLDDSVRAVSLNENVWAERARRPDHTEEGHRHTTTALQCIRREEGFVVDWNHIKLASYDVLAAEEASAHNRLLTKRSSRVIAMLETTSNYGSNYGTSAALSDTADGYWDTSSDDPASANYNVIMKTLSRAVELMSLATNGMVDGLRDNEGQNMFKLVLSPGAARRTASSPEIHNYVKYGPFAKEALNSFGLPPSLYGICDVVVENTVRVSERPKASGTEASSTVGSPPPRRFAKGDDTAFLVSRVGGLDGQQGSPSFSSVQIPYFGKEINIETHDPDGGWHHMTEGSTWEYCTEIMPAPQATYLIQDIMSS